MLNSKQYLNTKKFLIKGVLTQKDTATDNFYYKEGNLANR